MTINIKTLLATAIKIRDHKIELVRKHKEVLKGIDNQIETLELAMHTKLNELEVDTFKVRGVGTVFTTKKDSVTASDKSKLIGFLATKILMTLQGYHYKTQAGKWQPEGKLDLEEHVEKILESGAFDLLTVAPNKTNCKAYMESHEGLMPDGVDYYNEICVQFRKGK